MLCLNPWYFNRMQNTIVGCSIRRSVATTYGSVAAVNNREAEATKPQPELGEFALR